MGVDDNFVYETGKKKIFFFLSPHNLQFFFFFSIVISTLKRVYALKLHRPMKTLDEQMRPVQNARGRE